MRGEQTSLPLSQQPSGHGTEIVARESGEDRGGFGGNQKWDFCESSSGLRIVAGKQGHKKDKEVFIEETRRSGVCTINSTSCLLTMFTAKCCV